MKHCYAFLLVTLLGLFGLCAHAKETTITVTPGSSIVIEVVGNDSEPKKQLNAGTHKLTINDYQFRRVHPIEGHTLVSCVNKDGSEMTKDPTWLGKGYVELSYFTLQDSYTITTKPTSELEHSEIVINIDKVPSTMTCYLSPSATPVNLKPGSNTVTFQPDIDVAVELRDGSLTEFYSVKLDGVEQAYNFYHYLKIKDGSKIDIQTEAPAEEYTYTLAYEDEDNFWTEIRVDGKPVTITNNQFKAHPLANIELYNRQGSKWYIEHITMPDGMVYKGDYTYSPYEWHDEYPITFTARASGTITVRAHLMKDYNITFNITGLDLVKVLNGDNYTGTPIEGLKEGVNTVKLHETSTRVTVMPADESVFLMPVTYRATADGPLKGAFFMQSMNYYSVTQGLLKDGGEVNIVARDTPAAFQMTVNVDNPEDVKLYSVYDPTGYYKNVEIAGKLTKGENVISFPENSSKLYVVPATADSYISSVYYREKASDTPFEAAYDSWYKHYEVANPVAGSIVDIEAGHVVYDSEALVYVDDATATEGVEIQTAAGRKIALTTGYNTVKFNADENTSATQDGFLLQSLSKEGNFTVFINGTKLSNPDEADHKAYFRLHDGDIIKLYLVPNNPTEVTVNFTTADGFAVTDVTVDVDTPATLEDNAITVLPGTAISFAVTGDDAMVAAVTYNGECVKMEDDRYTVSAAARSTVAIAAAKLQIEGDNISSPVAMTFADGVYTAKMDRLEGNFTITDETNGFALGSNGNAITLNEPYAPVAGATDAMTLACNEANDVTVIYNHADGTLTVTGTEGIATVETADDSEATWYDLAGCRVAADRLVPGIYIRVKAGKAEKVAVK